MGEDLFEKFTLCVIVSGFWNCESFTAHLTVRERENVSKPSRSKHSDMIWFINKEIFYQSSLCLFKKADCASHNELHSGIERSELWQNPFLTLLCNAIISCCKVHFVHEHHWGRYEKETTWTQTKESFFPQIWDPGFPKKYGRSVGGCWNAAGTSKSKSCDCCNWQSVKTTKRNHLNADFGDFQPDFYGSSYTSLCFLCIKIALWRPEIRHDSRLLSIYFGRL